MIRQKLFSFALLSGAILLVGIAHPSFSQNQENNTPPKELELSYQDFDQHPDKGWRKIAREEKYLEAARLIDRYADEKNGLKAWQKLNLRFHAGQLYAFANQNATALERFKTALSENEAANSPIRWNAYVQATIAFLERDRTRLVELREEISKGTKFQGVIPNLDVVDRLIAHFEAPYSEAYRSKSEHRQAPKKP